MPFDAVEFGPALAPLLAAELNPLGPGKPDRAMTIATAALSLESAFVPQPIRDREMARACIAGLYLLHNDLDSSHEISQSIRTPSGSFWHGIMHRREGDFGNAKYWFERVGMHEVFPALSAAVREFANNEQLDASAAFLVKQSQWDAYRFIDLCAAATARQSKNETLCQKIQRREWELLFEFCYRRAVG